jgi:hypothetical protein
MLKVRGWKQRKNWHLECPVCRKVFDIRDFVDEHGELPPFVPAITIFYGRPMQDVKTRLYFCSKGCRNRWKHGERFNMPVVKDLVDMLQDRCIDDTGMEV